MHPLDFSLHEPATLEETAAALHTFGPQARMMAGGTDLLVDLKAGRIRAPHVISLARIPGLRGVEHESAAATNGRAGAADHALRIGALTTLAELERSPLLQGPLAAIREAVSEMAAPTIRTIATVGGNIAGAVPCADLPPILAALGAAVSLWSPRALRTVALDEFITGPRQTSRQPDEILTAITIPSQPPRCGAAFARFALRNGNAIAVASLGVRLVLNPDGAVREARIRLGAVAPIPKAAIDAEHALAGAALEHAIHRAADLAAAAAEPISDIRGSADYRRHLVGVLTKRALRTAHARATEALR